MLKMAHFCNQPNDGGFRRRKTARAAAEPLVALA
jgi:hypothetical protein